MGYSQPEGGHHQGTRDPPVRSKTLASALSPPPTGCRRVRFQGSFGTRKGYIDEDRVRGGSSTIPSFLAHQHCAELGAQRGDQPVQHLGRVGEDVPRAGENVEVPFLLWWRGRWSLYRTVGTCHTGNREYGVPESMHCLFLFAQALAGAIACAMP